MHKVGIALVGDARVEATGDLLPVLRAILLLCNHGDRIGDVEERRLVVLAHQTRHVSDKVGLERHGLLNVAVLVVDDRAVKASGGELLNAELLNEVSVNAHERQVSIRRSHNKGSERTKETNPQEGSCLPVTGMMGISGRILRM